MLVYKHRDAEGARQEVGKMIGWLNLQPGVEVLDLCCGTGRHAQALKETGYRVTGIDLSEVLLREARKSDPGKEIDWIKADMRRLPLAANRFDGVVNMFTSFGYFETDEEHLQVLVEAARVLKPGGHFVIDFLNPVYTRTHLVPRSERTEEGQLIKEQRKIENDFVIKDIEITDTVHNKAEPRIYRERIRLYTLEQFRSMLIRAGLRLEAVYGDYKDTKYDQEVSPRMIMVGRKAAS